MKRGAIILMLMLGLPHSQAARAQNSDGLVLPNPNLLRCSSFDCFQLWSETTKQKDVFPMQIIIDMDHGCVYGLTALYDKSIPLEQIKSTIDNRYKRWAVKDLSNSALHVWRVEPDQFSIQLSVAGRNDERRNIAKAGTRQTIYIAFSGKSACGPSPQ